MTDGFFLAELARVRLTFTRSTEVRVAELAERLLPMSASQRNERWVDDYRRVHASGLPALRGMKSRGSSTHWRNWWRQIWLPWKRNAEAEAQMCRRLYNSNLMIPSSIRRGGEVIVRQPKGAPTASGLVREKPDLVFDLT
jgi:hypothetical protein